MIGMDTVWRCYEMYLITSFVVYEEMGKQGLILFIWHWKLETGQIKPLFRVAAQAVKQTKQGVSQKQDEGNMTGFLHVFLIFSVSIFVLPHDYLF